MDFKSKETGSIFHVTNENLIPSYENNPRFEKVEEVKPKTTKTSKK